MEARARIALTICLVVGALKFAACTSVSNASRVDPSAAQLQLPDALAPSAQANAPEKLPSLPPDPAGQGRALTDYFHAHKLPLVGASVIVNQSGRQVILYGFAATGQGKTDAEEDAQRIVNDPKVAILNRIVVQPELVTMDQPSNSGHQPETGASPEDIIAQVANHQNHQASDQTEQYLARQSPSNWTTLILTLLMFAPLFIP